jgi:hypothetical protein
MSVRIEGLSVYGLGPLSSIEWNFGDINLIYGKNEKGKTFLVEYLLRSLFKNPQKLRKLTDTGQVIVSGLGQNNRSFSPKTKEKIEDLIFKTQNGIQVDLSRLCVVKGGELSLTELAGGTVTKSILKEYLSDQRILDKIIKSIHVAVRESQVIWNEIDPKKNQGLIKT